MCCHSCLFKLNSMLTNLTFSALFVTGLSSSQYSALAFMASVDGLECWRASLASNSITVRLPLERISACGACRSRSDRSGSV